MDAVTSTPDLQQEAAPHWYHALTLTERLAHSSSPTSPCITDEAIQTATIQRIKRWKEQGSFKNTDLFAQRLSFDNIAEQDLIALLSTPAETLLQHSTHEAMPAWLQDLTTALEAGASANNLFADLNIQAISPYLVPFQPLLAIGITRITTGMQELASIAPPHAFDPATTLPLLIANIARRIEYAISRPLILELHIARLQGQLAGDSGEERMADFLRQLSQRERLRTFLLEYPVLARYLVTIIQYWASYSLEFLRHLYIDWHDICTTFAQGNNPGSLQEIQDNDGDKHNRGRSVLLLRFSSGLRLVYKPRSLRLDRHFQDLLYWINDHGISLPLQPIHLLDRDSYGWYEFVKAQSCTTEDAVQRFYERMGSYLAIFYLLDATDFHAENLLAVGEHPIPIDLESLFHPRLFKAVHGANSGVLSTVLRTGLLPTRDFQGNKGQNADISGIAGGQKGQLTPMPIAVLRDVGTDQMRVDSDYTEIPMRQNRPLLNDEYVEVHRYTQNILHGFTETYRLLVAQKALIQRYLLPRFAHDQVRLIVRPTQTYMTYLQGSLHPDFLQDALARDQLIDHLWDPVPLQPYLSQFIHVERADLLVGDIPLFHTTPASTAIFSSAGERLEVNYSEPALTFVQQRLSQMNEEDLARQQWIIQASLATTVMDSKEKRNVPLRQEVPPVTKQRLIKSACAIGDRLHTIALRDEQGPVNWLGLSTLSDEQKNMHWCLEIANSNLYDGTPGVVLFLAYLGAVTGETGYTQLARAAMGTIQQQVTFLKQANSTLLVGAFLGLGSLIYLFSHLEALWQDRSCHLMTEDILSLIEAGIEQDERLDIIAGSAGCLASLLSLQAVSPSQRILSAALRCGDHLLARAQVTASGTCWQTAPEQPPLAGFSHGAAGIAYSLAKLSALTGETRFLPAIQGALAYERNLFSQEEKNWPFLQRAEDGAIISQWQTTWCHGAAGIGLGRLGLMPHIDDPLIMQEIETAIETTRKIGFGSNQSLCHGDLGNLETLLVAARMLHKREYDEQAARIGAMIFDGIERCGWVSGIPMGVETPGLMVGLSGIGYQLLRLAEPERVPSVLLLAPPR